MVKVADRKSVGRVYSAFDIYSKDPQKLRFIGEWFEGEARDEVERERYKQASKDFRRAAKFYSKASEYSKTDDSLKSELEDLFRNALSEYKKERRMAVLYEKTKDMNSIRRFIVRKIKGRYILASFALALFFSAPNLTGNAIGNKDFIFSVVGAVFFFIGVFLSYFFVWKNVLRIRIADK